jgi:hypothetical protein
MVTPLKIGQRIRPKSPTVHAMHSTSQLTGPTATELADGARRLLTEVDVALSGSAFAIINHQTRGTIRRYYDAAALRHCCLLLKDIETSSEAGQEMTVRILGRVFMEAWFVALYIHFGGWEAFERVAQNTVYQVRLVDGDIKNYDSQIRGAKKRAREKHKAVSMANAGIAYWNRVNPRHAPKSFLDAPYIPTLNPTDIDVSRRITQDLKGVDPRSLPVEEVAQCLSKLGPAKGFAQETFRPLYLWYRIFSAGSLHATLNVYDAYYQPGHFDRAAARPTDASLIPHVRITALYCTAFLVGSVLQDAGIAAPVATELRNRYEPDPDHAAWTPGYANGA